MIMKKERNDNSSPVVSSSTNDDISNNVDNINIGSGNGSNASSNGRNSSNSNHHKVTNANRLNERALLDKLQDMVPYMPNEKKMTKLNILKNAIEYIRELSDLAVGDQQQQQHQQQSKTIKTERK